MIIADIHSHILPGVDDGSRSLDQSVDMLAEAYKSGTRHIVATPHFGARRFAVEKDTVLGLTERLNKELAQRDIDMTVYPGNEIRCTTTTADDLRDGIVCPVNQNRYLLVELPFEQLYDDVCGMITQCGALGHRIVLAHPERHDYLTGKFDQIEKLIKNGVLLQCNADSLFGKNGLRAQFFAHKMMRRNMVSFIASDCHSTGSRGPQLASAYKNISRWYGKQTARTLFYENPMRMINGRLITNRGSQ